MQHPELQLPYTQGPEESPEPVHKIARFGAPVMDNVVQIDQLDQALGTLPEGPELAVSFDQYLERRQQMHENLNQVRAAMGGLSDVQSQQLTFYLHDMPQADRDAAGIPRLVSNWSAWMAERATDKQIAGVLKFHEQRLQQQQNGPQFQKEILMGKRKMADGLYAGIEQGTFHPSAYGVGDKIVRAKVFAGDEFDAIIDRKGGYHIRGSNIVVVQTQRDGSMNDGQRKNLYHEMGHRIGYLPGVLDEPINDLGAIGIANGGDVSLEDLGRVGYPKSGEFVYDLCTKGRNLIDIKLLTRAFSAQGEAARAAAWEELADAVDASWGIRGESMVLNKYVHEFNRQRDEYMEAGMVQTQAIETAAAALIVGLKTRYSMMLAEQGSATAA